MATTKIGSGIEWNENSRQSTNHEKNSEQISARKICIAILENDRWPWWASLWHSSKVNYSFAESWRWIDLKSERKTPSLPDTIARSTYSSMVTMRSLSNTIVLRGIVEFSASPIERAKACRRLSIDSPARRHVHIPRHPSIASCPTPSDVRRDNLDAVNDRTIAKQTATAVDFLHLEDLQCQHDSSQLVRRSWEDCVDPFNQRREMLLSRRSFSWRSTYSVTDDENMIEKEQNHWFFLPMLMKIGFGTPKSLRTGLNQSLALQT